MRNCFEKFVFLEIPTKTNANMCDCVLNSKKNYEGDDFTFSDQHNLF